MKADLAQIMKSTGLKHEIYKTISGSKFSSIGHLIKNSAKKKAKYVDFKSQGTQNGLQATETKLKSNRSVKKLHSPNKDTSFSNKKYSKQSSKQKLSNIQRSDRRCKATSSTQINKKSQNYLLDNSQKSSKSKQKKSKNTYKTSPISKIIKNSGQKIQQEQKCNTSLKSKSKTSCKINLQSILQQSSSQQQLITPDNKKIIKNLVRIDEAQQKTTKKEKRQSIPQDIRKRIAKSFTNPQKFIKLVKSELVSVSFRILKKKLIEVQIYTLCPIYELKVTLEKGNLQCQSIQQTYKDIGANTVLALFSSVRDINIMDPYNYPQIHLQISQNCGQQLLSKYLILPYTFLHLSEQKEHISSKKSRIKTKLCIQKVPINVKKLSILSQIFKVWSKKQLKGQSQFQTHFTLNQQDFKLKLIGESDIFTLELEGRGQEKLNKLLDFLEKLIC